MEDDVKMVKSEATCGLCNINLETNEPWYNIRVGYTNQFICRKCNKEREENTLTGE